MVTSPPSLQHSSGHFLLKLRRNSSRRSLTHECYLWTCPARPIVFGIAEGVHAQGQRDCLPGPAGEVQLKVPRREVLLLAGPDLIAIDNDREPHS